MAGGHAEGWSGMGTAWSIIGTLFAGILDWGGIGFLLYRWLDLRWLFLPGGMVAQPSLPYRRYTM